MEYKKTHYGYDGHAYMHDACMILIFVRYYI